MEADTARAARMLQALLVAADPAGVADRVGDGAYGAVVAEAARALTGAPSAAHFTTALATALRAAGLSADDEPTARVAVAAYRWAGERGLSAG